MILDWSEHASPKNHIMSSVRAMRGVLFDSYQPSLKQNGKTTESFGVEKAGQVKLHTRFALQSCAY